MLAEIEPGLTDYKPGKLLLCHCLALNEQKLKTIISVQPGGKNKGEFFPSISMSIFYTMYF